MVWQHREDGIRVQRNVATTGGIGLVEAFGCRKHEPVVAIVAADRGGGLAAVHTRALVAVVILHPADLGELRVHPGQVVVLLKVLADELPVGLDVEHLALLNPPLVEAVASHALRQVAEPDIELGSLVGEAGEEQRTPRTNPHGDQTEVVAVEVVAG